METKNVLIVSDEPEFGRQLTARWQTEPRVPALTQVSSDLWNPASAAGYDLLILGPLAAHRRPGILQSFGPAGVDVLLVVENDREAAEVQSLDPGCVVLLREGEWASVVVALAGQMVRRIAAQRRATAAENVTKVLQRRAALGRYMLEMRPDLNDALTSAMGNADLLLLESGGMKAEALDHVRTLHRMVLRLNEMVQRFSSLACELQLAEKASQGETEEGDADLMAGVRTRGRLL
ncbi:MAG TPA: hypothetical protein VKG84_09925 [Candidatus Acidoferrales bacterium]|nr:hypothetical protein [Candidatus Acidoferrales bacterium]